MYYANVNSGPTYQTTLIKKIDALVELYRHWAFSLCPDLSLSEAADQMKKLGRTRWVKVFSISKSLNCEFKIL